MEEPEPTETEEAEADETEEEKPEEQTISVPPTRVGSSTPWGGD